jgi:hypothetical protein
MPRPATIDQLEALHCELIKLRRQVKVLARPVVKYSAFLDGTNDPEQKGQLVPVNNQPCELELTDVSLGANHRAGNGFLVSRSAVYSFHAAVEWELVNPIPAAGYSVTFLILAVPPANGVPARLAWQRHQISGQENSGRTQTLVALGVVPAGCVVSVQVVFEGPQSAAALRIVGNRNTESTLRRSVWNIVEQQTSECAQTCISQCTIDGNLRHDCFVACCQQSMCSDC